MDPHGEFLQILVRCGAVTWVQYPEDYVCNWLENSQPAAQSSLYQSPSGYKHEQKKQQQLTGSFRVWAETGNRGALALKYMHVAAAAEEAVVAGGDLTVERPSVSTN